MRDRRSRPTYGAVILLVIAAGLASRSPAADYVPSFVGKYARDTLWALTVYLVLGFVFPGVRRSIVAGLTIAISFGVEFSQLYQADWINAIRESRIGALTLGAGFKWSDLVCYTAGCMLGLAGEIVRGMTAKGMRSGKMTDGGS